MEAVSTALLGSSCSFRQVPSTSACSFAKAQLHVSGQVSADASVDPGELWLSFPLPSVCVQMLVKTQTRRSVERKMPDWVCLAETLVSPKLESRRNWSLAETWRVINLTDFRERIHKTKIKKVVYKLDRLMS